MKKIAVLSREWLEAPDGIVTAENAEKWRAMPHEFLIAHWSTVENRLIYIVALDRDQLAATLEDLFGFGALLKINVVGARAQAALAAINARALH
jgi:hypothetical protein